MNARLIAITLLAATLGAATVTFAPVLGAPAPEPRAQRWEYKVVPCSLSRQGPDGEPVEKQLTDQFNALAKDGWEHSGSVGSESTGRGGPGGSGRHYVVFRRFKP